MNSSSKEIEKAGTLLDLLFSHNKCIGLILKLSTIICVACICFPFTPSNQRLLLSEIIQRYMSYDVPPWPSRPKECLMSVR